MTAQYVYGVVRADHPEPDGLTGVGDAEVHLVRDGAVAVAISAAPEPLVGRRRDLLAHSSAVEALWANGTVLPMRFGVVAPDHDALRRDVLSDPDGRLERRLAVLQDTAEVSVKVWHQEATVLREILGKNREIATLRSRTTRPGARYADNLRLGELVAAAVAAEAEADAEQLLADLAPLATAVVPGPPVDGALLNAAFLVDRRQVESFMAAVDRRIDSERDRMTVRISGPVPPYSFVEEPASTDPPRRTVGARDAEARWSGRSAASRSRSLGRARS